MKEEKKLKDAQYKGTLVDQGKHGIVGEIIIDGKNVIFKASREQDFGMVHESVVMKSLKGMTNFCPHFCKIHDMTIKNSELEFSFKKEGKFKHEILLMDKVKGRSFLRFVDGKEPTWKVFAIIKQILLVLQMAQNYCEFVHYDLHSENIILEKDEHAHSLYILDEKRNDAYLIPSTGFKPVIIDFGTGYTKDLQANNLWGSMEHNESGFFCDRFNSLADTKLFCISLLQDFKGQRTSPQKNKFATILRNAFSTLGVEWDSGWDNYYDKSSKDYVSLKLFSKLYKSRMFYSYEMQFFDLIQALVILPLEEQPVKDGKKILLEFLKNFKPVEDQLTSEESIYALKQMVILAIEYQSEFMGEKTRSHAVKSFHAEFYNELAKTFNFINVDKLDCEKLLGSLYNLAKVIEGHYFKHSSLLYKIKIKREEVLDIKSPLDMYAALEFGVKYPFKFKKGEKVNVYNYERQQQSVYYLTEEDIKNLDKSKQIDRGICILKKIKEHLKLSDATKSDSSFKHEI